MTYLRIFDAVKNYGAAETQVCVTSQLQSTDKEIIPATNATDAHAQDFLANEQLLLPIPNSFALQATQKCLMFSVRVVTELTLAPLAVLSPTQSQGSPHRDRHTPRPCKDHLVFRRLYQHPVSRLTWCVTCRYENFYIERMLFFASARNFFAQFSRHVLHPTQAHKHTAMKSAQLFISRTKETAKLTRKQNKCQ